MTDDAGVLPKAGSQITIDGHLVTVAMATSTPSGCDLVIRHGNGSLADAAIHVARVAPSSAHGPRPL